MMIQRRRLAPLRRRLALAQGGTFLLCYLGALTLFNLLGVRMYASMAHYLPPEHPQKVDFFVLWHSPEFLGLSLLQVIWWTNILVLVYAWTRLDGPKGDHQGQRLFFWAGSVVVLTFQFLYWKVGTLAPPPDWQPPWTG